MDIKEDRLKVKENSKAINYLVNNWKNTFGNLKHWNQELNGYTLSDIEVKDYGLCCRIYAPWGIDLFDLDKYTSIIESGCKCEFIYQIPQHRQFALAKFIYPNQVKINEWEFNPVKVKPWEFCPGYDVSGEPIIFNLNETPHILIAGQQRRGKNGSADHAIISWINSCDEKEITFYMFQCAKNDLIKYKDCKQVYCYADSLEKILIAVQHLEDELHRRTNLFEPMVSRADGNDNIYHYNKLHKTNKLPYIIVVIDEFIELIPDTSTDDKDTKYIKGLILKHLRQIGQFGGSLGINYLPLHQKPSKELMPPFIKNQASIRICFGFEDLVCCSIVLGDELAKYAHKLPPRKAYYSNNDNHGYLYTPNLKGRIRMFIEQSFQPNHRTLFSDLEKLKKTREVKINNIENNDEDESINNNGTAPLPAKIKNINKDPNANIQSKSLVLGNSIPMEPLEFDKVDPSKIAFDRDKLIENIKRIPGFVPYNARTDNFTIIDQTNIDFSKSEKPRRENGEGN